jgi:LETM1 and EF-hand domain-containing protein 1
MAKFLQDAVEQMSAAGSANAATKAFAELYRKARITGEPLTMEELVKLCHSLKDTLTLENLDRTQLVSLCKYMGIRAFGTDPFLRYQVRRALRNIYRDDELIARESVESLTTEELAQACRLRGLILPNTEKSDAVLRRELNSWLELHVKRGIPSVILILSRAMSPSMSLHRPAQAIKDTILSLPDAVVDEAELHQLELSGSSAVSYKQKLHVLEQQQELIAKELEQAAASPQDDATVKEEIKTISEAISVLASDDPVGQERQQLQELKVELKEFKEEAEQLEKMTDNKLREPKAAELINEKLEKLIVDLESDLQELHEKLGARLNLLSLDDKGSVTVAQLNLAFQLIKKTPTATSRLDEIICKFDKDGDGKVLLSDILQLAKEADEEEGQGVLLQSPEEKTKE